MNQLPNMSRRESSPKRKTEKKKLSSTITTSVVCILIIFFSLGRFPQVDAFFANLNEMVREHNDELVRSVLHAMPAILLGTGLLGLTYMLVSSVRSRAHRG